MCQNKGYTPVRCGKCVCGSPEPCHCSARGPLSLAIPPLGMIPATPPAMLFLLLAHAFSLLLDVIWMAHRSEHDKDVEILLLRQQLRILQRPHPVMCGKSIRTKLRVYLHN